MAADLLGSARGVVTPTPSRPPSACPGRPSRQLPAVLALEPQGAVLENASAASARLAARLATGPLRADSPLLFRRGHSPLPSSQGRGAIRGPNPAALLADGPLDTDGRWRWRCPRAEGFHDLQIQKQPVIGVVIIVVVVVSVIV